MSRSLFVEFRGHGFWAFDVVSGVFLKHLIDAAVARLALRPEAWLSDAVEHWRFNAVVSDCGLFLDENWTTDQVQSVTEMATAACDALSGRVEIPAEEISAWPLVDDLRIFPRGLPTVRTESPIRLGRAIIELVNGSLPEPPAGMEWYFGTEDMPATQPKRE